MILIEYHFGGSLILEFDSNLVLVFIWCPEEANKNVILSLHHVKVLIKCLLLGQEHFIDVNGGCFSLLLAIVIVGNFVKVDEQISQQASCAIIDIFSVFN